MKKMNKVAYLVALATTATLAPVATSHAAGTITFGEDQYVSVGFGMLAAIAILKMRQMMAAILMILNWTVPVCMFQVH